MVQKEIKENQDQEALMVFLVHRVKKVAQVTQA
jgi:hypothetical protein